MGDKAAFVDNILPAIKATLQQMGVRRRFPLHYLACH
jgi:hypothetical protein